MALSKKFLTRLAIGVVVAIVVLFIIWKIRNKSTYTVTSLKTGAAGSLEASFYSNISTCQNTFTLNTLGSVVVHSNLTCAAGTVTATTILPHKYTGTSTIYVQGASSDATSTGSTFGYNTTGTPVTVTPDGTDVRKFTYPAVGGSCSSTPQLTSNGYSWLSTDTATASANVTRETCITSNVQNYMNLKCTWTTYGNKPTASDGAAYTAYTAYQANLTKVKDAYANIVLTAPSAPTATKASIAQVQAAREADFTAATRQYLNAACPAGYYLQTSGVDPGSAAATLVPNSPYSGYVADTAATTGVNGFNKTLITDLNILNWAKYASTVGADNMFTGTAPLTASTAAGDPLRYSYKTLTSGSPTFVSGLANWQIAQDIGPGTVTMSGTIPGTTTAAGAPVTTSLVMNNAV
jgi:hypothetical protein